MHVTLGLFEMNELMDNPWFTQLQSLLEKIGLLHRVISFVKNESTNLATMATTLHFIVDYEPLKSLRVYEGTWFRHVMFKAYQSNTNDNKVFVGLQHVSVKDAQLGLQKNHYLNQEIKERAVGTGTSLC
jgi:hypothetical protein